MEFKTVDMFATMGSVDEVIEYGNSFNTGEERYMFTLGAMIMYNTMAKMLNDMQEENKEEKEV